MTAQYVEVMSVRVDAGSRTLYVDLKQNADGSRFVSISEVRRDADARSRILIDEEYLPDLFRALNAVLEFLSPKGQRKAYTVEEKRRTHSHAYEPWSDEEERRLQAECARGLNITQLAQSHGRTVTAIRARLELLALRANST